MSTVIKVENLSKRYRLGVINRDMLYKDLQSRWAKSRCKEDQDTTNLLWATARRPFPDPYFCEAVANIAVPV